MKIIAVYCSKGGVGKTATAVNLSYTAAKHGFATLLCDLDPQGASSYYFRIRPKKKFNSRKLLDGNIAKFIRGTDFDDLDLLPAHFSHRNFDLLLDRDNDSSTRLKEVFHTLDSEYDVVILDCPPNLTLLSENILASADLLVTPVIPTTLSILSLEQLLKLCRKKDIDRGKIHAFFSMAERRKSMHLTLMKKFRKNKLFLNSAIPYLAEVEKMGITRMPVGATNKRSVAQVAYERLWHEVQTLGELR